MRWNGHVDDIHHAYRYNYCKDISKFVAIRPFNFFFWCSTIQRWHLRVLSLPLWKHQVLAFIVQLIVSFKHVQRSKAYRFFKQNRDHNTSFTHKHRDLPWKPLTGKTRKPWSHTSYFLFITLWDPHNTKYRYSATSKYPNPLTWIRKRLKSLNQD